MIYNSGAEWLEARRRAKIKKPSFDEIVKKVCNLYDDTAALYDKGLAYSIAHKYEWYCYLLYGNTFGEWLARVSYDVDEHCTPGEPGEHQRAGYYALVKPYDDGTVMPKSDGNGLKFERIFLELSPLSVEVCYEFNRTFKYCYHDDLERFQEAVDSYNIKTWSAEDWAPYYVKLNGKSYSVYDAQEEEARGELEKHLKWFKMVQELVEELEAFSEDYYYINHKRPSETLTEHVNGIDEKLWKFEHDKERKDKLFYLHTINGHTRDIADWASEWSIFIDNVIKVYEEYLYPEEKELINKLYE